MLVLWVFAVAVDGVVGGRLAGAASGLIRRFLLAAAIPQIPLTHDVNEGGKLPRTLVGAVHSVANSDETDALLPEQDFGIETCLEIVTANSVFPSG